VSVQAGVSVRADGEHLDDREILEWLVFFGLTTVGTALIVAAEPTGPLLSTVPAIAIVVLVQLVYWCVARPSLAGVRTDGRRAWIFATVAVVGFTSSVALNQWASNGPDGVELARRLRPDLVLMDLRMPGGDGVSATRAITREGSSTRVVVLTTYETDQDILTAIEAGASGYLLKDIEPAALARAIHAAANGETVLAVTAQTALISRVQRPASAPTLSAQELAVLNHAAQGKTNAAIGTSLHISETTVKTYLSRAFEKLGVSDRTSAVRRAIELGLIN
jgi:DNA-binding NarL/FixJ family response regulator